MAILASAPSEDGDTGVKALRDFQDGIAAYVAVYGDGTDGPSGQGTRSRGFDLDSKVQVFETVIRGVGGLLSAHLFAIGELPITGYNPQRMKAWARDDDGNFAQSPIEWSNGLNYDGQLLRLAFDLAERLLPAFYSSTGMPYPRVNLRHGIPFYQGSPLNQPPDPNFPHEGHETTETCSAGAGSLVLEFTVLSRLTGDPRFEQLAKRAFWAVWARRSDIGLIGAGIDAEQGHWIGPFAGIGAGTDSFFEYALKTHILTSGLGLPNTTQPDKKRSTAWLDPNTLYQPLTTDENSPDSFLWAWKEAHAAVKRHLFSRIHHPHYVNVHLSTGSPQIYWIDSLGAYYPGLLTLAGELEEATETNLLYTALWTRYAALPERWSVREGTIEGGLGWWPGRPEFIESNYHLYRATKDPWYLYVGEMVLKDIQRRCWTPCGWSGLQDVRSGQKSDRMQSFFLGETAKYLYLLFDPEHPLNKLDAPYVLSTEGHPLIIPRHKARLMTRSQRKEKSNVKAVQPYTFAINAETCPVPPPMLPFGMSPTAARADVFHAASLIGLHNIVNDRIPPPIIASDADENGAASTPIKVDPIAANHTLYPWTLPTSLIPYNATCAMLPLQPAFSIQFPTSAPAHPGSYPARGASLPNLARINGADGGMLVNSLSGIRFEIVEDEQDWVGKIWRITSIGHMALGRDERVFIRREVMGQITAPSFTRVKDSVQLDLVIQLDELVAEPKPAPVADPLAEKQGTEDHGNDDGEGDVAGDYRTLLNSILQQVTSVLRDPMATLLPPILPAGPRYKSLIMPALAPAGPGAAALPSVPDAPLPVNDVKQGGGGEKLSWGSIYFADPAEACGDKLPQEVVRTYNVIVLRRGGCTFSEKLERIPSFSPSKGGLKLVIIVDCSGEDRDGLVRPQLDVKQTTMTGVRRVHEVPMIIVGGGQETWDALKRARSVGLRRRYWVESAGMRIGNLVVI